jgi:hypothetical protein
MPTQPGPMGQQMGVGEPPIRGQNDVTRHRQQRGHLIQQTFVHRIRHTTAGMFQHGPHERDGPSPIHAREMH